MNNETSLNLQKKIPGIKLGSVKEKLIKMGIPIFSMGLFLLIWWLITKAKLVNPMLLPNPLNVFATFWEMLLNGSLLKDTYISLVRVIQGFLLAILFALPIGAVMGMSRVAFQFIDPIIEIFRPIPPIAFIPLAIMWFGIGESSKIFIIG
jgi:ABC-type nitrate/sulfonate/bicarbonate transport system permease component